MNPRRLRRLRLRAVELAVELVVELQVGLQSQECQAWLQQFP